MFDVSTCNVSIVQTARLPSCSPAHWVDDCDGHTCRHLSATPSLCRRARLVAETLFHYQVFLVLVSAVSSPPCTPALEWPTHYSDYLQFPILIVPPLTCGCSSSLLLRLAFSHFPLSRAFSSSRAVSSDSDAQKTLPVSMGAPPKPKSRVNRVLSVSKRQARRSCVFCLRRVKQGRVMVNLPHPPLLSWTKRAGSHIVQHHCHSQSAITASHGSR